MSGNGRESGVREHRINFRLRVMGRVIFREFMSGCREEGEES